MRDISKLLEKRPILNVLLVSTCLGLLFAGGASLLFGWCFAIIKCHEKFGFFAGLMAFTIPLGFFAGIAMFVGGSFDEDNS